MLSWGWVWGDSRGDRKIFVTDAVVREPLFSRTLSLTPLSPWELSGPPPILPSEVMLPLPNSTRGLDIRQVLDWLILACGPPPARGDISHSFLLQTLRGWASFNAATTPLHSLVTEVASCPASVFWMSRAGVGHVLRVLLNCGGLLCNSPAGLTKNPLVWQEDDLPALHPTGRGGCVGSHSSFFQRNPFSHLSLNSHYGRETQVCFFVISFWEVFQSGLFNNSLWYLILLVL